MNQRETFQIERWNEVYAPNPAMLRLLLERKGYQVFQWGGIFESIIVLHKFHKYKIYQVVSGKLEINIERFGLFELETGESLVIPPETYHSVRFTSEETTIYLIGEKL